MGRYLLLFFIVLPVIELTLLIEVGSEIGAINTIGLSFLTAGLGIFLVRVQGMQVMAKMMAGSRAGEPLASPVVHGFFLLVAGFCLLVPGFLTDAFGALCLLPPVRLLFAKLMISRMTVVQPGQKRSVILEGDYVVVKDEAGEDESGGDDDDTPQIPPENASNS